MLDNQANTLIWPVPLWRIEEVVSAQLGPGRVRGNAQPACFSRQVSMYLAKHVCGWSLPKIGKFYNGRHHATVLHAVSKIEQLRNTDQTINALIEVLTSELSSKMTDTMSSRPPAQRSLLVDAIATRVIERIREDALCLRHAGEAL